MENIMDLLFRVESALVMVTSSGVIEVFKKTAPEFSDGKVWARISRLLPIAICMGLLWIPGLAPEKAPLGVMLTLGFVLGTMSGWFFDLFKKTIMVRGPASLEEKEKQ